MAFTVEDGTGVAGANSYMTDVELKAYHADRGNSITAGGGALQQALVRATDYLETKYGHRFKGTQEHLAQPLSFPRTDLYDRRGDAVTGIPDKLKAALAEYALRAIDGELYTEPTVDASGLKITRLKEKVGPIETDTQYSEGSGEATSGAIPEADGWLQEYLKPVGTAVRA